MNDKPNILFFFADDQRFDTIHALGNDLIHTPNLDKLVESGTSFTQAHIPGGTCGAVCMPSRAMLHTGRTLFHLKNCGAEIPEEHALLGETLRKAGYETFGTGKWHNGTSAFARSFTAGDEIFFGGMADHWNVPAYHFDPEGKYEQSALKCVDPWSSKETSIQQCDHITPGKHSTDLFCDATIDFLKNRKNDKPFFSYISLMAPHDPRVMPKKYRQMYCEENIPLPKSFCGGHPFDTGALKIRDEILAGFPRDPNEVKDHIADYYAMISHIDDNLGEVLRVLEETGQKDNTIIIFSGDNGLAVGQHGLFGKQNCYEHSVRVPLIFSGPGIPKNVKSDAYVYLLDIFPGLCDLLDIAVPDTVEGKSLAPALKDPKVKLRDSIYMAYAGFQRAVKNEQFKLIEYHVDGGRETQLFDLKNDPCELRDLSKENEYCETVEKLRAKLLNFRDQWDDLHSDEGHEFWNNMVF